MSASGSRPPALELRGICKSFGANRANRDISLTVAAGTVHGIVGENGAGKSTLMNIVYGYLPADSGEIRVAGRPVMLTSPRDALAHGIGMVHQHFMLVDPFTAVENVLLGSEGGPTLRPGLKAARAALERLASDYGLAVDLDRPVGELPVGMRQRVEILKALYRGADILILDEPTGVLTPQDAEHLFRILRALRAEGRTIILITHKLREVMVLTDRVTVMRRGSVVAEVSTAETSVSALAELMVGRSVQLRVDKAPAVPGAPVLTVENLRVRDASGVERVKGASLSVRAGEVVGIAGVAGNGQSELLEAVSGMLPAESGTIRFRNDILYVATPESGAAVVRGFGVGHVPEDRQRVGLVTEFAAYESLILGHHADPAWNGPLRLDWERVREHCAAVMGAYDVRPALPMLACRGFSGGNQQKLVLAREIERAPALLLVGQPTRGVDVGAIEYIHRRLIALRDQGAAILLVSAELDEILALSDRVLVMFDGRVVGEVAPQGADERRLGLMMAGAA